MVIQFLIQKIEKLWLKFKMYTYYDNKNV